MVSLSSVQTRFEVPLQVIEGGSGTLRGVLSEAEQNSQPTYVFAHPRRVLRVRDWVPIATGMVVTAPSGEKLLVGENGPSDSWRGVLWKSFRMFAVTHQVEWKRRQMTIDVITGLERDIGEVLLGTPWAVMEPSDRELNDSKLRRTFEQSRFICGAQVLADDLINGQKVTKIDTQLGLRVGMLV